MERKKASDFPQELLDLFHLYVHGDIDRRAFFERAGKFAVGGLTVAGLFEALKPNYAWAQQVAKDDARIRTEYATVPVAAGQWLDQGLPGAARGGGEVSRPCSSFTRTAASTRTSKTSRGGSARANFMAFAPDGLTSVGGYPGNDEQGGQLFGKVDRAEDDGRFRRRDQLAEGAARKHRPLRRRRLLLRRRDLNTLAVRMPDLGAAVPFYGGAPAAEDVPKIKAAVLVHHGEPDTRLVAAGPRTKPRSRPTTSSRRLRLPEGEARLPQRHDAALRRGGGEARLAAHARLVQQVLTQLEERAREGGWGGKEGGEREGGRGGRAFFTFIYTDATQQRF